MKNVSVWSRSRLKPSFFACNRSRPNQVGAGVGSGTQDFRSRSRPKKWRLRNTGFYRQLAVSSSSLSQLRYRTCPCDLSRPVPVTTCLSWLPVLAGCLLSTDVQSWTNQHVAEPRHVPDTLGLVYPALDNNSKTHFFQCFGSGMVYSGSSYAILEFRIQTHIIFC